jgi:hypothetical protein
MSHVIVSAQRRLSQKKVPNVPLALIRIERDVDS